MIRRHLTKSLSVTNSSQGGGLEEDSLFDDDEINSFSLVAGLPRLCRIVPQIAEIESRSRGDVIHWENIVVPSSGR
jgi:hypothetical protein